eukprot:c16253_g1_i2 orf=258-1373(+)
MRAKQRQGFSRTLVLPKPVSNSGTLPVLHEATTNDDDNQYDGSCMVGNGNLTGSELLTECEQSRGNGLDSPRTPCYATIPPLLECPDAPIIRSQRRALSRQASLNETKLLMTTKLKRTASIFTFNKHFEFIQKIGSGSFSMVYEAQDRRSGLLYAVKMSKQQFHSREVRERFMREVQTVESLPEHPHVVKYFRCWQQDLYLYIQMELCEGGSLRSLLDSMDGLIPESQVWDFAEQVASGLAHIHANGVLHLDVKPENIFIDSQGALKVGDFSLAVPEDCWDWEEGDGGYVAPELLRELEPGPEADMYSFGSMVYEWATGQRLPSSIPERESFIEVPAYRSVALQSLVQALLNPSPLERPSARQVLSWRESH